MFSTVLSKLPNRSLCLAAVVVALGVSACGSSGGGTSTAKAPDYKPIEMPRNSPTGFVCAFFATFMGFAMIWHIWWMVILGLVGAYATFVVFAWRDHDEYEIPADEVARLDRENLAARLNLVSAAGALR